MKDFDSFTDGQSENFENLICELSCAKDFSLDIGGTLVKIAYLSKNVNKKNSKTAINEDDVIKDEVMLSGYRIEFFKFETRCFEEGVDFICKKVSDKLPKSGSINVTGGGAYKYSNLIKEKIGLDIIKRDEIKSIIHGCVFVLKNIKYESFKYKKNDLASPYKFEDLSDKNIYPFLLVNIGSGVSIIKVKNLDEYERIGGTSMGGGTFLGLGSLLTNAKTFDELIELAATGKFQNIDMLVRDIYGGAYGEMKLPGDLIASSFAKAYSFSGDLKDLYTSNKIQPNDISKSLLYMISNEIGQISSLHAKIHGLKNIYFGGYFIRNNPITMHTITYAVDYFSKSTQNALFLRHDGYLGSIGCLLMRKSFINGYSWDENLKFKSIFKESKRYPFLEATTSFNCKLTDPKLFRLIKSYKIKDHNIILTDKMLTTEDENYSLRNFNSYDKFVQYWLQYMVRNIELLTDLGMIKVNKETSDFKNVFHNIEAFNLYKIQYFFDLKEFYISQYSVSDPFLDFKSIQNNEAISNFKSLIDKIDSLNSYDEKFEAIFLNIFAGNMFDVGSNEFLLLLKSNNNRLPFDVARSILAPKMNDIRKKIFEFVKMLQQGFFKKIMFFLDNSGYDLIYGVIPLIREFVKMDIQVVLVANSYCALNDIIYSDLVVLFEKAALHCPIIFNGLKNKIIKLAKTKFGSPFIDFFLIDNNISELSYDTDLVIIEGPYNSLLINEVFEFNCKLLKLCTVTFLNPDSPITGLFDPFFEIG